MKQKIHKLVQKIEQKEITDKSDDLVQEANKFYPELGDKLYEYFSYYSGRYVTKIEELVYSLMINERNNKELVEITNAMAELFIELPKSYFDESTFGGWSHSLCHLLEGYGRKYRLTLLSPEHSDTVEKLVLESAKRCIDGGEMHCLDRILYPLLKYNLDQIKTEEDLNEFSCYPEGLEEYSKDLSNIIDSHKYYDVPKCLKLFLQSTNPKEFIIKCVEEQDSVLIDHLGKEAFTQILNYVKDEIDPELAGSYLEKFNEEVE